MQPNIPAEPDKRERDYYTVSEAARVLEVSHDLTLLTYNLRHFQRIPGLKIYQAQ